MGLNRLPLPGLGFRYGLEGPGRAEIGPRKIPKELLRGPILPSTLDFPHPLSRPVQALLS